MLAVGEEVVVVEEEDRKENGTSSVVNTKGENRGVSDERAPLINGENFRSDYVRF